MTVSTTATVVLQAAATANGNGTPADVSGFLAAQQVEIVESAGGTATVTFEGSFDGATWYAIGYYKVDNAATLTRTVTGVSVSANTSHVYQLLDPYAQIRARISSAAGGVTVTVKLFGVAG